MNKKVQQIKNTVQGDMCAGDIHKTYLTISPKGPLREIADNIQNLYAENEDYRGFIENLLHYTKEKELNNEFKGLEKKLNEGGYQEDVSEAMELKERFSKSLYQNQFSEQTQELYVNILAHINTVFKFSILPLIKEGSNKSTIKTEILNKILYPLYTELAPTCINITMDEVRGMLYFLTGNCHIEWR